VFHILDGLAMFDMLDTLDELRTLGEFTLIQDNIGLAEGVGISRIQVAMAAVRDHGNVTPDGFAAAQGEAFSSLETAQQTDIRNFLAKPPTPSAVPPSEKPAGTPISQLSEGEKLSLAFDYARSERDEAWNRAIDGLKSPQSIGAIVFVAAAFIAAQLVPVTWIADAAALAALTIVGFFTGASAATFVIDIGKFFNAVNAQSDDEMKSAGRALADAVSIFGITAITGALTEGLGAGIKGATTPLDGPPPSGYADALAPGVGIARVPKELVPGDAPTIPPNMQTQEGGGAPREGAPPGRTKPDVTPQEPQTKTPETKTPETPAGQKDSSGRIISETRVGRTMVIKSEIGLPPGTRLGTEKLLPRGVEVGRPGWQRAHSQGQITGAESGEGILLAPEEVNQKLQKTGIEQFVSDLNLQKAEDVSIYMTTETTARSGTLALESITYRIEASRAGGRPTILYEAEITVDQGVENPDVDNPKITVSGNQITDEAPFLKDIPAQQ
jgi:hypothetical protein